MLLGFGVGRKVRARFFCFTSMKSVCVSVTCPRGLSQSKLHIICSEKEADQLTHSQITSDWLHRREVLWLTSNQPTLRQIPTGKSIVNWLVACKRSQSSRPRSYADCTHGRLREMPTAIVFFALNRATSGRIAFLFGEEWGLFKQKSHFTRENSCSCKTTMYTCTCCKHV